MMNIVYRATVHSNSQLMSLCACSVRNVENNGLADIFETKNSALKFHSCKRQQTKSSNTLVELLLFCVYFI